MNEDDELITTLGVDACARLLAATHYGRLAAVDEGRPHLVVLNHVVRGTSVYFKVAEDAWLATATADGAAVDVIYEVDSAFPVGRSGWSVMARGTVVRETDGDAIVLAEKQVRPWAGGDRHTVLRLDIADLHGLQVGRS